MAEQLKTCPVRRQSLLQPNALAVQSEQQSISYRELDRLISALTAQLFAAGLNKGDRLICIAENSLPLILLQLSCLRSGIIFCPLNPHFSKEEIEIRIAVLKSRFIWFKGIKAQLQYRSLTLDFKSGSANSCDLKPLPIDPLQICNIIFTSGSSGTPKAVMQHFSNHFYSALGSQKLIPLQQGDKNLLSLPLFHISGYAAVMRTLLSGATLSLSAQKLSAKLLGELQITHLSLVAAQLYRLLQQPAFTKRRLKIKHLLLGGSAFSEQLLKETAQRGFTYHLSYGLTEMSSQVATSNSNRNLSLLKYAEIKISDGEIFLRGKTRFAGYFNGTVAKGLIPEKQWFPSRDLGRWTKGYLQISGRADRQFISGGENIQPEEIESALLGFAGVKEAYVVAISDSVFGKRPVAFISWQKLPQMEELNAYLRNKLAAFKCPVRYLPLPQQQGLKVSLCQLQKYAQADLNADRTTQVK